MTNHTLSAEELGLERAEFEAVLCDLYGYTPASIVSRRAGVGYNDPSLCMALVMWQARAALARQPQPECGDGPEVVAFRVSLPDEPELGTWLEEDAEEEPQSLHHEPLCRLSDAQSQIADLKRLLAERDAAIKEWSALAIQRGEERDALLAKLSALLASGKEQP